MPLFSQDKKKDSLDKSEHNDEEEVDFDESEIVEIDPPVPVLEQPIEENKIKKQSTTETNIAIRNNVYDTRVKKKKNRSIFRKEIVYIQKKNFPPGTF